MSLLQSITTEWEKKKQDQGQLKLVNFHGWEFLQSGRLGVGPYFSSALQHRINKKLATNIVVCGEPGIGKSYETMDLCRVLEGLTPSGKDRFSLDQVVFTYAQFMDLVLKLPSGKPIIFDEPSYAMGKREWYKELNKALTQTIESFRFKVHPLFIPIINKVLLDKIIRDHLIQYQVHVTDRGKATVYRLKPSQFIEKIYHEHFCELHYKLFDNDQCDRESCLGCNKVYECQLFRARYERKKAEIQDSRYESAKEQAERTESKMRGIAELETLAIELKDQWLIDEHINVQRLRVALRDVHGIQISLNRAYQLKASLEAHNLEFQER